MEAAFEFALEQLLRTARHVLISLLSLAIAGAVAWFVLSNMEAL